MWARYLDIAKQLVELVRNHAQSAVLIEQSSQGYTPLHLAVKNGHEELAKCLLGGNIKAIFMANNDGLRPQGISKAHGFSALWCYMKFCFCADIKMATRRSALWNENEDSNVDKRTRVIRLLKAALEGEEHNVCQFLEEDPSLVLPKDPRWGTAPHAATMGGHVDMLRLLARFMNHDQQVRLILERDDDHNTALHILMLNRSLSLDKRKEGANFLVQAAPKIMPISSVSPTIRQTLVMPPNKSSLALTAVKARSLDLKNLINVLDYRGWRILSYAAYKGYLNGVQYFLINFPKSTGRYDSDGSLPIHKAVGGGQISIIKEFLLHCPQRLYDVDRKGQTILHFAVKCTKANVLSYLTKETEVEKIFSSRGHEGKTLMDMAEELKSVVVGRSIPSST
ncbi:hypothetical protein Cgig2_005185 [Carnegiea gigantea]|uniref:Uncharacterized protein n=1 Tax=Carnegiea gigantea TaxID=171969 RepID=A0A9Q1QJ94_9CARY|nr:hypothetical protein Cgig2_005185 [Carnegiea gigantea]